MSALGYRDRKGEKRSHDWLSVPQLSVISRIPRSVRCEGAGQIANSKDRTEVLSVQKVLSGSGRSGRLRLMEKYISHRLVARPEPDNTFWTDSTRSGWNGESSTIRCNLSNTTEGEVRSHSAAALPPPVSSHSCKSCSLAHDSSFPFSSFFWRHYIRQSAQDTSTSEFCKLISAANN